MDHMICPTCHEPCRRTVGYLELSSGPEQTDVDTCLRCDWSHYAALDTTVSDAVRADVAEADRQGEALAAIVRAGGVTC